MIYSRVFLPGFFLIFWPAVLNMIIFMRTISIFLWFLIFLGFTFLLLNNDNIFFNRNNRLGNSCWNSRFNFKNIFSFFDFNFVLFGLGFFRRWFRRRGWFDFLWNRWRRFNGLNNLYGLNRFFWKFFYVRFWCRSWSNWPFFWFRFLKKWKEIIYNFWNHNLGKRSASNWFFIFNFDKKIVR